MWRSQSHKRVRLCRWHASTVYIYDPYNYHSYHTSILSSLCKLRTYCNFILAYKYLYYQSINNQSLLLHGKLQRETLVAGLNPSWALWRLFLTLGAILSRATPPQRFIVSPRRTPMISLGAMRLVDFLALYKYTYLLTYSLLLSRTF